MSKLTYTGTISFDVTLVADLDMAQEAIDALLEASAYEEFKEQDPKMVAFTSLILNAYREGGIDGGTRELMRFNLREVMNMMVKQNIAGDCEGVKITASPVKFVVDTAAKVHLNKE